MSITPNPKLKREIGFALAAYAVMLALALVLGWRMHIPYHYYQLLDAPLLRERFGESLLYLHAQPPMLNFALGVALHLSDATGVSPEAILFALHVALGAAAVAGFAFLASIMIRRPGWRMACIAIFVAHPVFYMTLTHFFYAFHEVAYFAVAPFFVHRFWTRGRTRDFAAACALTVALVYTRSLFHFSWALALLAWILYAGRRRPETSTAPRLKPLAVCYAIAALLILAWPAKNLALFGFFEYSSWTGFNLSQGIPIDADELEDIPRDAPARFAHVPALTQTHKSVRTKGLFIGWAQNWNHYSVILESRARKRLVLESLAREPLTLAKKIALNYWTMTRFSGREPYRADFKDDRLAPDGIALWMRIYEIVTHLDFRNRHALVLPSLRKHRPIRPWHISGFFLAFPLILIFSARKARRVWQSDPLRARMAVFMLACIAWATAMILLVDGIEGNRMRFSTEQYVMALAFWMLSERKTSKDGQDARDE